MKQLVTMSLPLLSILLFPSFSFAACNVCHSKKPEMRRMHESLGYKDCFSCHGPTARPMNNAKRAQDLRCLPCHKS